MREVGGSASFVILSITHLAQQCGVAVDTELMLGSHRRPELQQLFPVTGQPAGLHVVTPVKYHHGQRSGLKR